MSNARRKLMWSLFLSFPLLVKANSANSPLPLVMDNFHSSFRFSMCSPMWYDYIRYIDRPLIGWVAPLKTICCNSDVMLRQWFSTVPPLDLWWAACPQSKWPIIYMYSLDHISRTECKRRGRGSFHRMRHFLFLRELSLESGAAGFGAACGCAAWGAAGRGAADCGAACGRAVCGTVGRGAAGFRAGRLTKAL